MQALSVGGSNELQTGAAFARAQAEIQAAIVIAKRYPRQEEVAYTRLLKAATRPSFAEDCAYSFPRGDTQVTGPSVVLAREAARIWMNLRHGLAVLRDDSDTRLIRGWAWDLETNTYCEADDDFSKEIQRYVGKGRERHLEWVEPDERDLRELTNRRGAILVRNCILQLIPRDIIDETIAAADKTLQGNARQDPDAWKKVVKTFDEINVPIGQLVAFVGHSIAECSPAELTRLRQIYKSIADGNSTWAEYIGKPITEDGVGNAIGARTAEGTADLKERIAKAAEKQKEIEHRRANGAGVMPAGPEPARVNASELRDVAAGPQVPGIDDEITDDDLPDNLRGSARSEPVKAEDCKSPKLNFRGR